MYQRQTTNDYLTTEEKKFLLFKTLSKDGQLKKLAPLLPYSATKDLLLPEVLQGAMSQRINQLSLEMHLHFIAASCVVEVCTTLEQLKLADVFDKCHQNLLFVIENYHRQTGEPTKKLDLIVEGTIKHSKFQTPTTLIRQNNEHNRLTLRKIAKSLQSNRTCAKLANQVLESLSVVT